MRSRVLVLAVAVVAIFVITAFLLKNIPTKPPGSEPSGVPSAPVAESSPVIAASSLPSGTPSANPSDMPSPTPVGSAVPELTPGAPPKASNQNPDLSVDAAGLSKATVVMTTSTGGTVKFKFYPNDAPNTIKRFIELINQVPSPVNGQPGFFNGLKFHRVVPGFVVQGGDPKGDGTGGSGTKLKAEFNSRRHVEGTVAMARAGSDPDSADSQFYFALGTFPHLDRNYTVFGQVTEGLDVIRNIKIDDKITSMIIE